MGARPKQSASETDEQFAERMREWHKVFRDANSMLVGMGEHGAARNLRRQHPDTFGYEAPPHSVFLVFAARLAVFISFAIVICYLLTLR